MAKKKRRINYGGRGKIDMSRHKDIVERYKSGLTCAEIGRQVNLTRERVRQILKIYGITPSEDNANAENIMLTKVKHEVERAVRDGEIISKIDAWTRYFKNGHEKAKISYHRFVQLADKYNIKFTDLGTILSERIAAAKLRGRPILTRELLRTEYIDNGLSQGDIAKKYGYSQAYISKLAIKYKLQKR